MRVGRICSRGVVVVQPNDPVIEAARLLSRNDVGCLVVVHPAGDEETAQVPVGIVTDRDIVLRAVAEHPERLVSRAVAEVMSRDVLVAYEDDEIQDVLERMRSRGVRRIPIVDDDNKLQGILTRDDILDWVSAELSGLTRMIANEPRPGHAERTAAYTPERFLPR